MIKDLYELNRKPPKLLLCIDFITNGRRYPKLSTNLVSEKESYIYFYVQ